MTYTIADVGDIPGRTLSDAEKQAIADEWNAHAARPERWQVPKLLIVERLAAAGKLAEARTAIDGSSLVVREKWNAATSVWNDNDDALALLSAIGADPAVILAKP